MRRPEILAALGLVVLVWGAAKLGSRRAPDEHLLDLRPSTRLDGPGGTSAVAATLERLGLETGELDEPLFRLAEQTRDSTILVFLDLSQTPTRTEATQVRRFVEAGGRILVAGSYQFADCFGYRVESAGSNSSLTSPARVRNLPVPERVLDRREPKSTSTCQEDIESADTLLSLDDGRPVSVLVHVGTGTALLVSDVDYFTNQALRKSDAAAWVVPLIARGNVSRVLFDEYHHGFGQGDSIWSAAWHWLVSSPAGWVILNAAVVSLIAIFARAVRFGRPVSEIPRRRRSEIEHLDALAAGLAGSASVGVSVRLLVSGLRRRLGGEARIFRSEPEMREWLATLRGGNPDPESTAAIDHLITAIAAEQSGAVLQTANAVEECWKKLRFKTLRPQSSRV